MANNYERLDNIILNDFDGKEIVFRNFAGKESKYNQSGKRTFNIVLSEDEGRELEAKGWRIKWLKPQEPGDPEVPTIKVRVAFGHYPPKIYLVTSQRKTELTEDEVAQLDRAEIVMADLIITPYVNRNDDFNGDGKASAYLKLGYFTVPDNPFESKYANLD